MKRQQITLFDKLSAIATETCIENNISFSDVQQSSNSRHGKHNRGNRTLQRIKNLSVLFTTDMIATIFDIKKSIIEKRVYSNRKQ